MPSSPRDIIRIALRPALPPVHSLPSLSVMEVEVGQLYRKTDAFSSLWEVISSFEDGSGIRHARLRNTADPTAVKLIAEAALRNPKFYRRAMAAPAFRE